MSVGTRVPYVKQLYAILAAELTDDVPTAARRTAAYLAQFCDLNAPSGAIKVEVYGAVDMATRVMRNDDPRASAEFMPAVRSFLERGGVPFFRLKGVTVGPVLPPGQPGDGPAPAFTLDLADRALGPAGLHSAQDTAFQIAPHKNVLLWRRTFSRVNVLVFNTANPPTVFTPALLETETYLEARDMAVVTGDDPLLFAATIARAFDFARLEAGAVQRAGVVLFDKSMPSPDNAYTLTKYAQAVARFIDWEPTKAETMLPTTEKRKIARSAAAMKGRQMEGDVPFLGRAKVNLVQFPTRRGDYLGFAFPESVAAGVLASIMKPVGAPSTSACAACGAADAPWVRPAGGAGGSPGAAVCGAACALAVAGKSGEVEKAPWAPGVIHTIGKTPRNSAANLKLALRGGPARGRRITGGREGVGLDERAKAAVAGKETILDYQQRIVDALKEKNVDPEDIEFLLNAAEGRHREEPRREADDLDRRMASMSLGPGGVEGLESGMGALGVRSRRQRGGPTGGPRGMGALGAPACGVAANRILTEEEKQRRRAALEEREKIAAQREEEKIRRWREEWAQRKRERLEKGVEDDGDDPEN